jgi:F0F1-type ATP synthase membrane subunit b/b'
MFVAINQIFESSLSVIFISFILFLLILGGIFGLWARFGSSKFSTRIQGFVYFVPTAMSTVGVIGTFCGIFIGLFEFDVSNIDESVPLLLAGLKIAFATSIVGMTAAILFRLLEHLARAVWGSKPQVASGDDPLNVLQSIDRSIKAQVTALVGQQDKSIASILERNRQDINDGFKDQLKAFNDFAEKMKEGATEKIVEALQQAIVDFNDKITQQFGDNFKELNAAVGNLNTWQQEYKSHVEQTEAMLKQNATNLESIASNVSSVVDEAKVLPDAASKMMEANNQLLQNFASMNALLSSLANIRADADVVLPKIEKSMQETTSIMETASKEMAETMRQTLEQTQKGINANFKTFDEQMQSELSKVLEQMGTQLTSLSGKFVDDYTPLTEELRRMMQSIRVQ